MTAKHKALIKAEHYNEALRYMDNAKKTLKKAGKIDGIFQDKKYVKTACGIAYNAVLLALDGYLGLRGVEIPKGRHKSIEFYKTNISAADRKVTGYLHDAYEILHLSGYYDGLQTEKTIKLGFELANGIIETIKPTAADLKNLN